MLPYNAMPNRIAPHRSTPHRTASHRTAPHCTALHCTALATMHCETTVHQLAVAMNNNQLECSTSVSQQMLAQEERA